MIRQAGQLNCCSTSSELLGAFNIIVLHKQVKRDTLHSWCGVDGEELSEREEVDNKLVPARFSLSDHSRPWKLYLRILF